MKTYILTVIGAAVLSAFTTILTPEKWRKYISLITGLVIISCIMKPVAQLTKTDLFSGFNAIENTELYEEYRQSKIVIEELEKSVARDIEKRLKDEFGINAGAKVNLTVNENNEITGVKKIRITGCKINTAVKERLCYIYGTDRNVIENE